MSLLINTRSRTNLGSNRIKEKTHIMDIEKLIDLIPEKHQKNLLAITQKINEAGFECFMVGGSVRDLLRGISPHEYDIATSATPQDIKKIFPRVIETGIQHGTVTVRWYGESYEVTTYRIDKDYIDGRRPAEVEFGVSLSEDLRRRDFTMNAVALDIKTHRLIDEHGGIEDIQAKIIRTIGDPMKRFSEDGLRPVRAIRFMSTLGFTIEEKTYKAIYQTREITARVSVERFHDELNKALASDKPYIALYHFFKNKIFKLFISEPFDPPDSDDELHKIDLIPKNIPGTRIAYWLYIILKHQNHSLAEAEIILKKLKFSRHNIKDSLLFLQLLFFIPELYNMNEYSIRKKILSLIASFIEKGDKTFGELLEFYCSMIQVISPDNANVILEKILKSQQEANGLTISALRINGNLILKKYPLIDRVLIGKILADSLDLILKSPEKNSEEELLSRIADFQ